ncbi:phosphate ABC transporter permease subunit PstC [Alicyclobacillus shizuokensis]|uniref:phosphate ABC transporter permease subunit PstC n=1 Tax=Alicyclobacillus shizuokensis TaxID=392014 RepID=UPI00083454FA|nr:phosphate ABC transporter permease subunit PstC [Alicyclobacillus shizuokensis]MCL6627576.1 phosphate ABC transporter permease subunit PstC [Alicyclobacillus shizuokensis]
MSRGRASRWVDIGFRGTAAVCSAMPLVLLAAILAVVVAGSLPSIRYMGWQFITGITWNLGNLYGAISVHGGVRAPAGASYGALVFLVGTLASSAIALVIAVPVSVLTAAVLAYQVRGPLQSLLSLLVELLAGIPSVVFGLWGILVLAPWVGRQLGPGIAHVLGWVPFLGGAAGTGLGLLSSGLVLALMIIPIITAAVRDLLMQVPRLYREGGFGLGLTSWEVLRHVCLPIVREGLIGAVALGWGRAMGETMAVLMVGGSALNQLPENLYSPISTMAAVIANQLDSALTDASHMAVHALAELAALLLVLTVATNLVARLLVNRVGRSTTVPGVRV